jgi:DNA-binding LytR/AlgR family response regulator
MIRALIIDDEELARTRLRRMLSDFDYVQVVDEACGGLDAVTKIESHKPDLILLDVQMPDLDGFGVLQMADVHPLPMVIFVTAYDQYAVEAFEVSATDYLMKPVRRRRLQSAIEKVREKAGALAPADVALARLLQTVASGPKNYLQRLPARARNRIIVLGVEQIAALTLDRGLVYAMTSEGVFWTKYTAFSQIEDQLDPNTFLRVHRQAIVNLDHVREITAYDNSTARLTLSTGHEVSVSRNQMKRLRQALAL